jgi:hypothetical protein
VRTRMLWRGRIAVRVQYSLQGLTERPRRGRSLPPSSGSTQVGTTPCVAFRAMIGADGEENVEGAP